MVCSSTMTERRHKVRPQIQVLGFYVAGFLCLGGEEVTIRQDDRPYSYQLAAMLCFLIFADNLLGRIEGPGETMWLWLKSGRWELIFVFGVLSVVCQLLFWSRIVLTGNRRTRGE